MTPIEKIADIATYCDTVDSQQIAGTDSIPGIRQIVELNFCIDLDVWEECDHADNYQALCNLKQTLAAQAQHLQAIANSI